MFISLNRKKGQNTAEYAIVVGLVVAAALAMQTYVKRGLQAGIKYGVDKTGSATTAQYEPYYLRSQYSTTANQQSQDYEAVTQDGKTVRESTGGAKTRTGSQTTLNTDNAD